MRVVMVTPDSRYIDRRILQEAETLVARGHEVILLAEWEDDLPLHERIGNVKLERLYLQPSHLFIQERSILYLQRKLPALVNITNWALELSQKVRGLNLYRQAMLKRVIYYNPDVVHIHDLPYLNVGVQAKRYLRIPLIYDAHELYPEIDTLTAEQKHRLTQLEQQCVPHCDAVITVNPFIAEEMSRRYHISRPKVILNAIAVSEGFKSTPQQDLFRQQFKIPAKHQILLFQGWLSLDRGLQELVWAMAQVSTCIHLVLMGYGTEAKQHLEQIASEAGVSSRVHFKQAVSQADLLFWTASADAGIIPYQPLSLNNYYCSPNKLFEFIQAELPIIANDLPFLRQIVAEEGFGVVMSLPDVHSYAQAIQAMFDPEVGGSKRFKANLHEKKGHYDWQVEEVKLLDIYAKLNSNFK